MNAYWLIGGIVLFCVACAVAEAFGESRRRMSRMAALRAALESELLPFAVVAAAVACLVSFWPGGLNG